jgi:hypothetical protein
MLLLGTKPIWQQSLLHTHLTKEPDFRELSQPIGGFQFDDPRSKLRMFVSLRSVLCKPFFDRGTNRGRIAKRRPSAFAREISDNPSAGRHS